MVTMLPRCGQGLSLKINSINRHQTYSELFFNSNKVFKKCTAYTALYRVHSILYISYAVKIFFIEKKDENRFYEFERYIIDKELWHCGQILASFNPK